jgi:elongation of very long chain fatty acids protein 1
MEKRQPYDLTEWIRFYNCFQVVVCSYFVAGGLYMGFSPKYFFKCESFSFLRDNEKLKIYAGIWLFLGLRVLEFIETIFFVLRKKHSQASFLHIFHHIGSVTMTWLFIAMHAGKAKKSVIKFGQ